MDRLDYAIINETIANDSAISVFGSDDFDGTTVNTNDNKYDTRLLESESTVSNDTLLLSNNGNIFTEEKSINTNKPWRNVIRRRVIHGSDDNES